MLFDFLTNGSRENEARAERWVRWVRLLTIGFCAVALVLGAVQTWTARFAMNSDGIQYLDNATAYWSGDFQHAINSQWSPLYPWLIGAWFAVARPSPYLEFPLVHILNFLIYLLSLAGFLYFLSSLRKAIPALQRTPAIHLSFLLIAFSSFLYCSLDFTSLAFVTPDLLVSLFTFLAAGLLLRVVPGGAASFEYVALGAVLGLGYLAKTPFLVFGLLCLAIAAALTRRQPASRVRLWLAVATFAAIAVPYIWILSNAKGRFTVGDSGRWNIIWMVNRVPLYNWQGGPAGNGVPIHPTRQLSSHPAVFEFDGPVGGTYPPWYDPIYWTEGAQIAVRPGDFLHALLKQIQFYGYVAHHRQLALVFALVTYFLLSDKRRILAGMAPIWPVLLLGAMPFAMYAVVHAEARYLAPYFVLLWTALAAAVLTSLNESVDVRVVFAIAAVAAALMLIEAVTAPPPNLPTRLHYEVAREVETLGIKKGDRVAIVTGDFDYFWARLVGARVTMQLDFGSPRCVDCQQRPGEWEKAKQILASHGVVLLVSPCLAGVVGQPGWRELGNTGVYAYRFP